MSNDVLREKSKLFAIKVIKLCKTLKSKNEYELASQFLRSGTSIWALLAEAKFAQSRADLISKFSIALKEANETQYWLDLLNESWIIENNIYEEYFLLVNEIIKILIASINTLKWNS